MKKTAAVKSKSLNQRDEAEQVKMTVYFIL